MILKATDYQYFIAGDLTRLTEVLHPKNSKINLPFSIAFAFLEKNETSLLHTLQETEIYFIVQGQGEFSLDEESNFVTKGDCILVSPYRKQTLKNIGEDRLEFLCIVTPPWTPEGERILTNTQ